MTPKIQCFAWRALLSTLVFQIAAGPTALLAAESRDESKQTPLIRILESDAPPQEKAITCKKLAIYGGPEAVPALAALLPDADLASWARIALEAIPGPAADDALRTALGRLQGRLLVGVINSIGVRRDPKAVPALGQKLNDAEADVAVAVAETLGRIGGAEAAKILEQALASVPDPVRGSVAGGCVRCAERLMQEGKMTEAVRLYDKVRQANVPKQRLLEATRGAILARQSAGIPLLLEQLRSTDKDLFGVGLRTARELPGHGVSEVLVEELDRSKGDRQMFMLLAIADRADATVYPTVLKAAQSGAKQMRMIALGLLDRFGDPTCVPVLLQAAAEDDADLARTAQATLSRLEGSQVDTDLVGRLAEATGKMRQALIEVAGRRRIDAALPAILASASDSDPAVRRTALETVGLLGDERQAPDLVRLLSQAESGQEREQVEKALLSICGRSGTRCLPQMLPLAKSADSALRRIALRGLAAIGGPQALGVVVAAVKDPDETVQDEAVGALAGWPNTWPEDEGVAEPLLELAKSGRKLSYQVRGARGYLQHIREDRQLTAEQKLAKVKQVLPLLQRPEEKRLAIAVLGTIPSAGSLELLMKLAEESAMAEEACLEIVKIAAGDSLKDSKELRRLALRTAADKSSNDSTKKKAEEALRRLN